MQYAFWSRFEALFYHADPHHGNIIVQEGCKLVFIDFGSCGTTSRKSKMAQLTIMDRLRHNDVSGTVEAGVSTLEPLPLINVYSLKKAVEADFWNWLFAFRDKKSEWWERTQAGLWLALMEQTRKRHIPIGLETLRLFRSVMLIDTLVYRLDPKMTSPEAFNRYERTAMKRGARKVRHRCQDTPFSEHKNMLIKESDELLSRIRYYAWQAERFADSIPNEFAGTVSKFSYMASEFLRAGIWVVIGGVVAFLYFYWFRIGVEPGQEWEAVNKLVSDLLTSPLELGVGLLLLVLLYRRVAFRVNDLDVGRRGTMN